MIIVVSTREVLNLLNVACVSAEALQAPVLPSVSFKANQLIFSHFNLFDLVDDYRALGQHLNALIRSNRDALNEKQVEAMFECQQVVAQSVFRLNRMIDAFLLYKGMSSKVLLSACQNESHPFYDPTIKSPADFFDYWVDKPSQVELSMLNESNPTGLAVRLLRVIKILNANKQTRPLSKHLDQFRWSISLMVKPFLSKVVKTIDYVRELVSSVKLVNHAYSSITLMESNRAYRKIDTFNIARLGPLQYSTAQSGDIFFSNGQCYGHVREWAENILKENGMLIKQEEIVSYEPPYGISASWRTYLKESRYRLRVVNERQDNQVSKQKDTFNLYSKRDSHMHYVGHAGHKNTTFMSQTLIDEMKKHRGQPTMISLKYAFRPGGHAVACCLSGEIIEGVSQDVIRFYDPNTAEFVFKGPDVEKQFQEWLSLYAKKNDSEWIACFAAFQTYTFKEKPTNDNEDNPYNDWAGVGRSVLNGPKYSILPGILRPYIAARSLGENLYFFIKDNLPNQDTKDKSEQLSSKLV